MTLCINVLDLVDGSQHTEDMTLCHHFSCSFSLTRRWDINLSSWYPRMKSTYCAGCSKKQHGLDWLRETEEGRTSWRFSHKQEESIPGTATVVHVGDQGESVRHQVWPSETSRWSAEDTHWSYLHVGYIPRQLLLEQWLQFQKFAVWENVL